MITNTQIFKNKSEFLKSTNLTMMPSIELDPEEADAFINLVVDQSFWMKNCRIEKMTRNEKNIRYMDFSSTKRMLYPAGTFSSSDYIKTLSEGKVTLSSKKFRGAVVIYDDDLEDNIEGAEFADHVMNLISKRVANELDEALYCANTTSTGFVSTDIRHMFNGFRSSLLNFTADSGTVPTACHELDASSTGDFELVGNIAETSTGAPYNLEVKFKKMLSTLPNKYKGNFADLKYYLNPTILADYTEKLQARQTPLGDKALVGQAPAEFANIPIQIVPLMPITYDTGSAGTEEYNEGTASGTYKYGDCILTNKNNFVVGLHRSLKLESERSAADEATYVFYSIRMDAKIQNPDAAVILHNITNG